MAENNELRLLCLGVEFGNSFAVICERFPAFASQRSDLLAETWDADTCSFCFLAYLPASRSENFYESCKNVRPSPVDRFLARVIATYAVVDVALTAGPLRAADLVLTLVPVERRDSGMFRTSKPIPGGDFLENRPILSTDQVGDDLDPVYLGVGIGEPTRQQGSQCDEAASKCWH